MIKNPKDVEDVFAKSTCLYSKVEVDAAIDKMAESITEQISSTIYLLSLFVFTEVVLLLLLLFYLASPLRQGSTYKDPCGAVFQDEAWACEVHSNPQSTYPKIHLYVWDVLAYAVQHPAKLHFLVNIFDTAIVHLPSTL